MVTWTDVRTWRHGPLEEAGEPLRSVGTTVADLKQDAQCAGTQIISQALGVDAARAALGRYTASHGEFHDQVACLTRATFEASAGVAAVEKKVLAALDYADAHPMITLHPDGTVSTHPATNADADPTAGEAAGASGAGAGAAAGLAGLTAEQIQAQAAELEQMVSTTLTHANEVDQTYASALADIATPNPQPGPSPTPPNPNQPAPTRSQQGRDTAARNSRGGRLRNGGQHNGGGDANNQDDWLGDGVPGEHADMPGVKPWQYQGDSDNEGSGPYAQRSPTLGDYANHEAATLAADGFSPWWPDAAENLHHYLGNTGDPQSMNVDKMLTDLPQLSGNSENAVKEMAGQAVTKSQESGATGPMTYPFTTAWSQEYTNQSTQPNWFYATGNYKAATDGTITVYPPSDDNPEWTYKYDYRVHTADRYNWDGTKSTDIVGVPITDKQLQELHQAGLAQEYDLVGESSVQHGEGPP